VTSTPTAANTNDAMKGDDRFVPFIVSSVPEQILLFRPTATEWPSRGCYSYTQTLENSTTICSQHRVRPKGGAGEVEGSLRNNGT